MDPRVAANDLHAVESGSSEATRLAAAAAGPDARYAVQLGSMMGALALVVGLTVHSRPWVMIVAILGYAGLMQVVVYRHQRGVQATARGWRSRFAWALGATVVLYTLGIVGSTTGVVPPSIVIWVPYAVVVAAPMGVLAAGRRRLS